MKCAAILAVNLASLILYISPVSADDTVLVNNPYATIGQRNIFGLRASVPTPPAMPAKPSPPKITATGIMFVFGQWQVLFKMNYTDMAGQPARADSYILGEGEQQDDVAVKHIDGQTGVVTFNNHGVLQDVFLTGSPDTTAQNPPTVAPAPARNLHPASFENSRTPDYLGGGSSATPNGQPYQNTTLEQRIILIEAQRAYLKSRNDPAADLLPPTALTPSE